MTEVRKNEVFDAPSAKEQMSVQATGGLVFDVPVVEAPLPSNGVVYPEGSPLCDKSEVLIEAMTTRQENILTNRSLAKRGTLLSHLIKSCMKDKSVDPQSMLVGDRNTIMVALRVSGYGPDYKVMVGCSKCGEQSEQEFDLSKLAVKRLELKPDQPGKNVFTFKLPQTKATVQFKFLVGSDEEEIAMMQTQKKKKGLEGDSDLVTSSLLHSIISINGITDRAKIAAAIPSLPAFDSRALRKFVQDNEPGMEMKGWMECPHCDHSEEVDMPLGANFFWPDA